MVPNYALHQPHGLVVEDKNGDWELSLYIVLRKRQSVILGEPDYSDPQSVRISIDVQNRRPLRRNREEIRSFRFNNRGFRFYNRIISLKPRGKQDRVEIKLDHVMSNEGKVNEHPGHIVIIHKS